MVKHHITFQCQLSTIVFLEKEMGVVHCIIILYAHTIDQPTNKEIEEEQLH
jgi:hypothetical protein